MEQPRSWPAQNRFIIKSRQSYLTTFVSVILTLVLWAYSAVVAWFFLSAALFINDPYSSLLKITFKINNGEIRMFMLSTLIAFVAMLVLLLLWRKYNYHRFGSLRRRNYPPDSTKADMEELGLMSKKDINKLKSSRYVTFTKSPVREISKDTKSSVREISKERKRS
ncbi:poly-beta-1,6-N-acetyl-D-glucosamine biosynthesis protein PgaD [Sinobaca qinghaiensis]|uniref:Poly-beta-1,6-N-acetyl-D-glucosamine biosynthesis protein PgaD n=1 Tax=Sinobaca qinghaiensis TaxID=342944 RepID=A0A419V4P6_9BACL|nr:poly-beta-1,6-N-acetyl-D-glucosamine biosynthesis protein PgaD [Sinobaca qinghaiensis]RKD73480.1 poly-beta-1,6-N-acetyl-D-glucosamine biosynthesis protein PgaD [Sinobaca qinghaiensis]